MSALRGATVPAVRARGRRLLRAAACAALTLAAGEAAVRLSGYAEQHLYEPIYQPFPPSPEIPYVHKPGLVEARARGSARVSTDALGLRSVEAGRTYPPKRPGELRIAFAGDSGTFGEGVARTEDTFVQIVEDRLRERLRPRPVRTFNFGASAYSVREMAATLEHRMPAVEPDWVVMVVIPHDFVLSRTPAVDAEGYLTDRGLERSSAWSTSLRNALRRVHLLYLLRDLQRRIFDRGRSIRSELDRGDVPDSYEHVRRFRRLADGAGRRPLLVIRPSSDPPRIAGLLAAMRRDGIEVLDLSWIRDELSDEEFRASRFDAHPSAKAHRRIGAALADYFAEATAAAGGP